MKRSCHLALAVGLFLPTIASLAGTPRVEESRTSIEVRTRLLGRPERPGPFARQVREAGFEPGDPIFIRVFKQTEFSTPSLQPQGKGLLELWIRQPKGTFELFKSYPVANFSGYLGPKLKEGDRQAPEGFYQVTPELMNPNSVEHLAMNLGYPNEYDQSLGHTGSYLEIHGGTGSIGCYAMTDPVIEEIYVLAEAALNAGEEFVPVDLFPFPLTVDRLAIAASLRWIDFWSNLAEGYDLFESTRVPPLPSVEAGRYVFTEPMP